ncbi:glycosyltransferase family 4 protein, partial [Escherichia coli]|nr:glycosyltransferase family 4 protein [Escherichia coli]
DSVNFFEQHSDEIILSDCRLNALKFSEQRFKEEIKEYVMNRHAEFLASKSVVY